MDDLERELKQINGFNKIPANGSKYVNKFTSKQLQDKRLSFRVTAESHQLIKEMADRRNESIASLSKDIMSLGLKKNFQNQFRLALNSGVFTQLNDLVYQTQLIGNNVNQIAKSNNKFNKDLSLLELSESKVQEHDDMNNDIKSLYLSVQDLSKKVNKLCQQLQK